MQNPNQQPSTGDDLRGGVNLLYFLAKAHSTSITPFCRHSFGTAYPGFPGMAAVLMMILTMTEQREIQMGGMVVAWFVVVLGHRLRMLFLLMKSWKEHSHYAGKPWLTMRLLRIKDELQAKNIEPLLCIPFGVMLMIVGPATGMYVAFGFVSMSVCRIIEFAARRRQVVAMQDMMIEQQDLLRRIRNRR